MSEIIYLKKSKAQLVYEGFKYQRRGKNGDKSMYYVCVNKNCSISVTVKNDEIMRKPSKHNHHRLFPIEIDMISELNKLKEEVTKDRTLNTRNEFKKIHKKLLEKYSKNEVAEFLPTYSEVKAQLGYHKSQKKRKKETKDNNETDNDDDCISIEDEEFIRINTTDDEDGMLLFLSKDGIEVLKNAKVWHTDGTFKSAPKPFYQILTIHGVYEEKVLPCAYILLKKKDRDSYEKALIEIKKILTGNDASKENDIKIEMILSDFEKALQQAFFSIFSYKKITLKGCWFHFNQALIRKLFSLGFQQQYYEDYNFRIWFRQFGAVALIPMDRIKDAWDIILDSIPCEITKPLIDFILYFIATWLKGEHGNTFSPCVWNHYNNSSFRTNNNIEGFHSNMNKQLQTHPNIQTVIDHIEDLEMEMSDTLMKIKQGHAKKTKQRKEDLLKEENLATIQEEFKINAISFEEYFKKLTYQVAYPYGEHTDNNDVEEGDETDCDESKENNADELPKKKPKKMKICIPNPCSKCEFTERIDIDKLQIKPIIKNESSTAAATTTAAEIQPINNKDSNKNENKVQPNNESIDKPNKASNKRVLIIKSKKSSENSESSENVYKKQYKPNNRSERCKKKLEASNNDEKVKNKDLDSHESTNKTKLAINDGITQQEVTIDNAVQIVKKETPNDDEIQHIKTTGGEFRERVPIRPSQLLLEPINNLEWVNALQVYEFQQKLQKIHPKYGFYHPNFALDSSYHNIYANPDTIHDTPFVQILHAHNHWVTLTNYNQFYQEYSSGLGIWFLYDSLNNPEAVINYIKPALKRLNVENSSILLYTCKVYPQYKHFDCGLYAMAYAMAILEDKHPAHMMFQQISMRDEYNQMIKSGEIKQFTHIQLPHSHVEYKEISVNLSQTKLIFN